MPRPLVVITGGGGALGRATAVRLASLGYDLILTGRTQKTLTEAASEAEQRGARVLTVEGNAQDEAHVTNVFSLARSDFSGCYGFMHAVGDHGIPTRIENLELREWESVIASNLRSAFLCTRAAVRQMLPLGRGSIVLVGSPGTLRGFPMSSPYTAAKAAMVGFARAIATEVSPKGIRINILTPGPTPAAAIFQNAMPYIASAMGVEPEQNVQMIRDMTALRRICTPEELARAATFLLSDDAALMTGQNLVVDAGLTT